MPVNSGQTVVDVFYLNGAAGPVDSSGLPTAVLFVNGVLNSAVVTVTHLATGEYQFSVALPAVNPGDQLTVARAATVDGIPDTRDVWHDTVAISSGGGGGGSDNPFDGAYTLTITTVDGSSNPISGVEVAVSQPGTATFTTSDGSGEVSYGIRPGTYTVTAWKSGYSSTAQVVTIGSASRSITITMTLISPTPATGNQSTAYGNVFDALGNVLPNAAVDIQLISLASTDNAGGRVFYRSIETITADGSGYFSTPLVYGALYQFRANKGNWIRGTVNTTPTWKVPDILGGDPIP